jgi:hypothetical protein
MRETIVEPGQPFKIVVTQEDSCDATPTHPRHCLIARALNRVLGDTDVLVGHNWIFVNAGTYKLCPVGKRLQLDFDGRTPVEFPVEIELLPTYI